ncbi:RBM43 protein, partial [Malurus elegans]|nr:RBM43 protein [Malurus elegans]
QVFPSVTSTLDMAVFEDLCVLGELLEEMKNQSPALSFGPLQPNRHVAVQGSFPALRVLRDFLLLKAESLSEKDKGEGDKPHQRLQEHGDVTESRNSVQDAPGEKQVVVLDTDIYHYMRHFLPKTFQAEDVVVSGVSNGDITTVCIESSGTRAGAEHGLKVKKRIENCSVKLQKVLWRERICFENHGRGEKQRYRRLCERLKPQYPAVLTIPYDTHIDVVGISSDVLEFAEEVRN